MTKDATVYQKVAKLSPFVIGELKYENILIEKLLGQNTEFLYHAIGCLANCYGKKFTISKTVYINDQPYSFEMKLFDSIAREPMLTFEIPTASTPINFIIEYGGNVNINKTNRRGLSRQDMTGIILLLNEINLVDEVDKALTPIYNLVEEETEKQFQREGIY